MAQPTDRTYLTRQFGAEPRINMAPTQTPTTSFQGGAAPAPKQQATLPPAQVGSFSRPPTQVPTVSGGGGGGGFSSTFQRTPTGGGGGGGGSVPQVFQPASEAVDYDQDLVNLIKARSQGEGIGPSFDQVESDVLNPFFSGLERDFSRAQEQSLETLAARGILSSGETVQTVQDFSSRLAEEKASIRGQMALEFERDRQTRIGEALNQLGVLEQGRVTAQTTIRATNTQALASIQQQLIQSDATVRAASIQAGAQVSAAAIGADASVKVAQIGAQAALQRAGMDYDLAIRQLDQDFINRGIDPVQMENNPVYRQAKINENAYYEQTKRQLLAAELADRGINIATSGIQP